MCSREDDEEGEREDVRSWDERLFKVNLDPDPPPLAWVPTDKVTNPDKEVLGKKEKEEPFPGLRSFLPMDQLQEDQTLNEPRYLEKTDKTAGTAKEKTKHIKVGHEVSFYGCRVKRF